VKVENQGEQDGGQKVQESDDKETDRTWDVGDQTDRGSTASPGLAKMMMLMVRIWLLLMQSLLMSSRKEQSGPFTDWRLPFPIMRCGHDIHMRSLAPSLSNDLARRKNDCALMDGCYICFCQLLGRSSLEHTQTSDHD